MKIGDGQPPPRIRRSRRLHAIFAVHARENNLPQPRIAVVAADAWPLPWYLRKFSRVGYWQPGQETGPADFWITSTDLDEPLKARLKDFRPEFFGVRPGVLILLWIPPAFKVTP